MFNWLWDSAESVWKGKRPCWISVGARTLLVCGALLGAASSAHSQAKPESGFTLSGGVSALTSAGSTLPAFSVGGYLSVGVMRSETLALRLSGSAYAPVSYSGDAICLEAIGGGTNCADRGQHASQIAIGQIELLLARSAADESEIYGQFNMGIWFANEAVQTHSPSVERGMVAGAGIGRRLGVHTFRLRAEAQILRFQGVFGNHQWAFVVKLGSS